MPDAVVQQGPHEAAPKHLNGSTTVTTCDQGDATGSREAGARHRHATMRIVSWNVGLRGLKSLCAGTGEKRYGAPDTHGIAKLSTYGSLPNLLEGLEADVVCLQEIKTSDRPHEDLASELASCEDWLAFFAPCRKRGGYAGCATFVRRRYTPVHAEEGLTGLHDRFGGGSGRAGPPGASTQGSAIAFRDDVLREFPERDLSDLDGEGRCVITDHGLFVLVNVYVPAVAESE